MKVKTSIIDADSVELELNTIGIENVLYIIPYHLYSETLFLIVYKGENK